MAPFRGPGRVRGASVVPTRHPEAPGSSHELMETDRQVMFMVGLIANGWCMMMKSCQFMVDISCDIDVLMMFMVAQLC